MVSKPTIVFDFDNTLIDRQAAAISLMKALIAADFPADQYSNAVRDELLARWYVWDQEGHVPKQDTFGHYLAYTKIPDRTWEYYDRLWTEHLWEHTTLFPESKAVLDYLSARYRLALLTNGSVYSQGRKLKKSGLAAYFAEVIITGEYGIDKPDPRIYMMMCERLKADPHDCIFIGDSLDNDVKGPIMAGMQGIWIYPDPRKDTDVPCQRIYHIGDIRQLL